MDIASMLEVEVQEVTESKENVTPKPKQTFPCQSFTSEENDFYKLTYGSDIAAVRFLRLHCTACDEHIGSAPSESHNIHEHPVLRVLLCAKCREFYGDGTFEQGEDATDMFCRWCANGGNLYCCSYCSNTFCSKCIKRNFDPPTIKRIEAEDSWKCFVCDPKDLYPLRSIARALIAHIEVVTRILENNKRMSPREKEEKMHLDETKCCSRKRKRRRQRTLSGSDEDIDDDEDVNYEPKMERVDSPPTKKRKARCSLVRNTCSNGFLDHEYNKRGSSAMTKLESDYDPSELISQCEQTMIEGDNEIISTVDETNGVPPSTEGRSPAAQRPSTNTYKVVLQKSQQMDQHGQPLQKIQLNNSMGTLNPVPIANLLKAMPIGPGKRFKVTHGSQKLVAVPVSSVPKSMPTGSLTFVKPSTHFLVPKAVAKTFAPIQLPPSATLPPPLQPIQRPMQAQPTQPTQPTQQPSVIDLDSDDESIIVENVVQRRHAARAASTNVSMVNEGDAAEENVIPEPVETNNDATTNETAMKHTRTRSTEEQSAITIDGVIPVKTQQRYRRFEKMLKLQSQEIDGAVNELKTKILKLVQNSIAKPSAHQQDADLQSAAFVCTKRFHRALRKALVELSHINDRLVKDYLHWKKKSEKAEKAKTEIAADTETTEVVEKNDVSNKQKEKDKERANNIPSKKTKTTADIPLEMVCERESASESEDNDDITELNENHEIEAIEVPAEFSSILDHLSLFKRKPTSVKAVGNDSVLTEDKGCQVYDVPWRDYEKCIGYSLLTKSEYDPETKQDVLRPVRQPDENFGKYQEQYLFYLQHVEDYGIETDETKGLPDPNHIPLKDLIDSSSPFIMDMLERLSPVNLPNGCTAPAQDEQNDSDTSIPIDGFLSKDAGLDAVSDCAMDTSSHSAEGNSNSEIAREDPGSDKKAEDPAVATSKAVEELQKMVTKLSEDLRNEQQQQQSSSSENKDSDEVDLEQETLSVVNSVLEVSDKSVEGDQAMDVVEILDLGAVPSNDDSNDCTTLD